MDLEDWFLSLLLLNEDFESVLCILQATGKPVWAKVFTRPVKKWRSNLVINNMLWDHLVHIDFDSRLHYLISLMHLAINENTTLFRYLFEQVLESNSSTEAENCRLVLCVVMYGVLTCFQPPTAKLHIKYLTRIVKGSILRPFALMLSMGRCWDTIKKHFGIIEKLWNNQTEMLEREFKNLCRKIHIKICNICYLKSLNNECNKFLQLCSSPAFPLQTPKRKRKSCPSCLRFIFAANVTNLAPRSCHCATMHVCFFLIARRRHTHNLVTKRTHYHFPRSTTQLPSLRFDASNQEPKPGHSTPT